MYISLIILFKIHFLLYYKVLFCLIIIMVKANIKGGTVDSKAISIPKYLPICINVSPSDKSIFDSKEEIILNITNQETIQNSHTTASLNFWNYLLYKSRKSNKNNLLQSTIQSESKCLIQL